MNIINKITSQKNLELESNFYILCGEKKTHLAMRDQIHFLKSTSGLVSSETAHHSRTTVVRGKPLVQTLGKNNKQGGHLDRAILGKHCSNGSYISLLIILLF